jgi:hypothetical protein
VFATTPQELWALAAVRTPLSGSGTLLNFRLMRLLVVLQFEEKVIISRVLPGIFPVVQLIYQLYYIFIVKLF